MNFRDRLQRIFPELSVPRGFTRYGHAVVLRSPHPLPSELGDEVLNILPWSRSVYQYLSTTGENRRPVLKFLAGEDLPVVYHKENGVTYSFNLYHTMFSAGNRSLRETLVRYITPADTLLDMFTAVGNLSLQPVVHTQCQYVAVEKDPLTFQSLIQTLILNDIVPNRVLNIDCRLIDLEDWASSIFMGYHEVDFRHMQVALVAAKKEAKLFLHPICRTGAPQEWIDLYSLWIEKCGYSIESHEITHVKRYSPGLSHYLLVFCVTKNH